MDDRTQTESARLSHELGRAFFVAPYSPEKTGGG